MITATKWAKVPEAAETPLKAVRRPVSDGLYRIRQSQMLFNVRCPQCCTTYPMMKDEPERMQNSPQLVMHANQTATKKAN